MFSIADARGGVGGSAMQDSPPVDSGAAMDAGANPQTPAGDDPFPLTELPPLRRLVLYNSGVGQWQHRGEIDGNARLQIQFGIHDVDDVLKSLVFADNGGGSARAVEYKPAPDPEDVAAKTLGAPMTLAQLVQRFRGEQVSFSVGGRPASGTVYGVENRRSGDQVVETVVLINENGIFSVELESIDRLSLEKPELRRELEQALAGLVKSRTANRKRIELLLEGEGKREVEFAYVVEVPIWRMTYRLAVEGERASLQGWAHVDNVTGVDWREVAVELRSGRPMAFHSNVFLPLMAERPSLGDSVYEFVKGLVLVTQWLEVDDHAPLSGWTGGGGGLGGGGFGGGALGGGGGGLGGMRDEPSNSRQRDGLDIDSAFRAAASQDRAAQSVRYRIEQPVSLAAGRSAALPVFASRIPARLLTVCDETADEPLPMHAIEFRNETGLPVVSGPVSILLDGDFAGDGKLTRLAIDEKTEVAYGLDRAVQFERVSEKSEPELKQLVIEKDQLVLLGDVIHTRNYRLVNEDSERRQLVIYSNGVEDEKAVVSPQPDRIEAAEEGDLPRLRFELELPPQSVRELAITFTSETRDEKLLVDLSRKSLEKWLEDGAALAAADREVLDRLLVIGDRVANLEKDQSQLSTRREALIDEQARMRENVQSLRDNREAAQPFIDKLLNMETELESIERQREEIRQQIVDAKADREQQVESMRRR